jgi:uncharacterized damage-inducible protein DinB
MATAAERQKMIAQIRELPAKVEESVRGIPDEEMNRPAGGEGWSIRQVVHHMADAHLNAFTRMKLILTEEKPIIKPYDQEAWAELPDTTQLPLEPSLQILRGLHYRWSSLLESVAEGDWQRQGVHLENGLMTLDDGLTHYSGHGENHLRQIAKIKVGLGR